MQATNKQTLKIYFQHARKYPWVLLLMIVGAIGAQITWLVPPLLYKNFFDILGENDTFQALALIRILVFILLISLIGWALRRAYEFADSYYSARVSSDLSNTVFSHLHHHSANFFNNNFVGSLTRQMSRFVRGFEEVSDNIFYSFLPTFITIGFIFVVLAKRQMILALAVIIWAILFGIVQYFFIRYKLKFDIEKAKNDTIMSGVVSDTITNNINLKLFSSFESEFRRFKKLTDKSFVLSRKSYNLTNYFSAVQGLFTLILEVSLMALAVIYWERGVLTIGDFALIQSFLIAIFSKVWDIGHDIRRLYEALTDAKEMTEILNTPHQVVDAPEAKSLSFERGDIEFNKVGFSYSERGVRRVFNDFSLQIKNGERVALIGPSGGGKSTLVKLLFRFFDLQSGEIRIDGQNIAGVTQDSLRNNLSLVPQEPILFHRSLMDNIRYSKPDATDEEVIQSAKLARCHDFIRRFPDGYQTFVGERGVKLSGGERQRVAIARAILKNAPILVLDEATSSLDSESEKLIQEALKELMKDKTTIVIAHRLSTIMQMDKIIVIEDGKITEEGKHTELLKVKEGTYQKLWQIQAGGFIK